MSITVSIVLYDDATEITGCLRAVAAQTRPPDDVVIFDNASTDGGLEMARGLIPDAQLIRSPRNIGFAAGHNRAMTAAPADYHLVLNPDARIAPDFLLRAMSTLERDASAGSLSGRLLRFRVDESDGGSLVEYADDVLDSTGMIALRNRRVLDRDSDSPARDLHVQAAYVFGASGAAAVYRRAMLEDVAVDGEYFDESFFAYREDVDLAWRAQMLGWRCRYEPLAIARHRRRVAPGRRRQLPSKINRLSVANRWRMIAKNESDVGWRRDWPWILGRDVGILGVAAIREPRTLFAVADVVGDASRIRVWRREGLRRRRADPSDTVEWFGRRHEIPVSDVAIGVTE